MYTGTNTTNNHSGNGARGQNMNTTSFVLTAGNDVYIHVLEQANSSGLANVAGNASEVSQQIDPMGAWDWSI